MPAATPMHVVSRELLERVRRDVLVRLLEPYRLFFAARRIDLDALAATAQDDHAALRPLHDLLAAGDPLLPPALAAAFPAIEAVACDAGHERLRVLDQERALPQGRLGHETLAAIAYLDHPALFAQVKLVAKPATTTAYTEYAARSKRALPPDPARFAALGVALGALLAARGRPPHCEPIVTRLARETVIDFVFGRLPATHERLTESLQRQQVTDVLTQRVRAFFHHATCTLGVQGHPFMREAIRRLAGEHLMDDAGHFRVDAIYSLAPLAEDLDAALAPEDGVASIELREIWLRRVDGVVSMYRHDVDLRRSSAGREIRAALADGAVVEHAKLLVTLTGRTRAVRVEIEPPGKLDMPRGEPDVMDRVKGLLALKGMMRLPESALPDEGDAASDTPRAGA